MWVIHNAMNNNNNNDVLNNIPTVDRPEPNGKGPKKSHTGIKIAVTAVAGVVLGGGIVYGAFSLGESGNAANDNAAGITEISKTTKNDSTEVTKAFNKTKNTVVSVVNLQKQGDTLESMFGGNRSKDTGDGSSTDLTEYSEGSGLIYKNTDGKAYIVTNNHVVADSDKLEVILNNGKKLTATLVGTDEVTDLAVLTVKGDDIKDTAVFGDSSKINVGQTAIAIGSPLGSEYATSVTSGIISAKSRTVPITDEETGQTTGESTVIQTDAAINPGNSGGPLINVDGQVIGINSMKLSGSGVEGMGFAIPSDEVVEIINQLVKDGKVVRPALGISSINLSDVSSSQQESVLKLPADVTSGVVLAKVSENGPAGKAGLKQYDVITAIGDTEVTDHASLQTALYKHKLGDTIKVTYYRDGKKATADITLSDTTDILSELDSGKQSSSSSSKSKSNSGRTGGSLFGGE